MTRQTYVDDADVIVFNGGEDIATSLYNEQPHGSHSGLLWTPREKVEVEVYKSNPNKFKLGICRGSQFLNVMNGGSLWQDVDNHCRSHLMTDLRTGEKVMVTSTHHQMMRPNRVTGTVIAIADEAHHKQSEHDTWSRGGPTFFDDDYADTEVVWYPATRTLCIQGHPEYVPGSHFAEWSLKLLADCYNETMELASAEA